MKFKITLLILAGIALTSFDSCTVLVGRHGGGAPRVRHMGHRRGVARDYVQPTDNGLRNSFATPPIIQPLVQIDIAKN